MSAPFDAQTLAEWRAQARREIREADPDTLAWHLEDELSVPAFLSSTHPPPPAYLATLHGYAPAAGWLTRVDIDAADVAQARAQTQTALNGGADALSFGRTEQVELPRLLAGLPLRETPVTFRVHDAAPLLAYLRQYHPSRSAMKGSVQYDPLADWLTGGAPAGHDWTVARRQVGELFDTFGGAGAFCPLAVGWHHYHAAGATAPQELAYGLAQAMTYVDWLLRAGVAAAAIFKRIEISVSVGSVYLVEIAKLRALRWLWLKLAAACGVAPGEVRLQLHVRTSEWTLAQGDPYVNLLRHTTQAMAAVLGGTQALTVQPHVAGANETAGTAARLARNVSTLLREEAGLDRTADPLAGAYSVEYLTDALVRRSWQRLLEVQRAGGWLTVAENGTLLADVLATRDRRVRALREGRRVMVGVNRYQADPPAAPPPPVPHRSDGWPAASAEHLAASE